MPHDLPNIFADSAFLDKHGEKFLKYISVGADMSRPAFIAAPHRHVRKALPNIGRRRETGRLMSCKPPMSSK